MSEQDGFPDQRAIDHATAMFRLLLHGAAAEPIADEAAEAALGGVKVSARRRRWMLASLIVSAHQIDDPAEFKFALDSIFELSVFIFCATKAGKTETVDCRRAGLS